MRASLRPPRSRRPSATFSPSQLCPPCSAMPSFEGCADVLSACQPSTPPGRRGASDISLDAQDASSNLRSIRSLFVAAHAAPEQRAHKRRKVNHDNTALVPIVDLLPDRSIVLANVSLELVSNYATISCCEGLTGGRISHPYYRRTTKRNLKFRPL
jgi:hypothetical protein